MSKLKCISLAAAMIAGLSFQQLSAMPFDTTSFGQQSDSIEFDNSNSDGSPAAIRAPSQAAYSPKCRKHHRRHRKAGRSPVHPTPSPSGTPGGHQTGPPNSDPGPSATPGGHETGPPNPDPAPSATPGGHETVPPISDPGPSATPGDYETGPFIPDPILDAPPGGPGPALGGPGSETSPPPQGQSVPEGGSTLAFLGLALVLAELLRRIVRRGARKI
jgi:hypothetical protein